MTDDDNDRQTDATLYHTRDR